MRVAGRPCCLVASRRAARLSSLRPCNAAAATAASTNEEEPSAPPPSEVDVVVIGSGLGGLCAAALLARYGLSVTVVESHSVAGGATHAFKRQGFTFESGPSLFSDLSARPSENPIAQVLHFLGESVEVKRYNTWHVHVPEGSFVTRVGDDSFAAQLGERVGAGAAADWRRLVAGVRPLSLASTAVPAAAVRSDAGAALTLARFLPRLLRGGPASAAAAGSLLRPASEFFQSLDIGDAFVLRWLDLLCFLLSGSPASGTVAAELGFMFDSWYGKPGACLEYPLGGAAALADALLRSFRRDGGTLRLGAHVERIVVEGGRACGVALRGGGGGGGGAVLRARLAVISNASVWDTLPLLPAGALPAAWLAQAAATPALPSFVHLHLGMDAAGLPASLEAGGLEAHHISVEDWGRGVGAPQNVVLTSIASLLDPSLAPAGCHVVHAYVPATEPWDVWAATPPGSAGYDALKAERSEVLWRAVERAVPDARRRARVALIGTPHTHRRYLRRHRGSYGAGPWCAPGDGAAPPPGAATPLPGLLLAGDSLFPGAGVPAVAAAGLAAAHALVPAWQQCRLLDTVLPLWR